MRCPIRCLSIAAVVAAAAFLLTQAPAHADWPLPRADTTRTGAAQGQSNLRNPVPYWRYYLGGSIVPRGAMVLDVDRDTTGEVIFVSGGKLVARERSNALVWETPVLGISQIIGLADFDQDGEDELAVHSSKQVFLVQPSTGRILWEEPASDFGFLGGARVGDIDHDGAPDLFVQECGCCRINNGNTGFVYRFARGFDAAEKLFTLPSVMCGGYKTMAIVDIDGNGTNEITLGEIRRIRIFDPAKGTELATTEDLGDRVGESQCIPVDLDGNTDHELVCIQSNSPPATPELGHRAFMLDYVAPGRLVLRWQRDIGELNRSVTVAPGMITDLDNDTRFELLASGQRADGTSITLILDALTGEQLTELPGDVLIAGTAHLHPDKPALILTTRERTLSAWTFTRTPSPRARMQWSLSDHRALTEPDWPAVARVSLASKLLTLDLTGDGTAELITAGIGPGGGLMAYDISGENPVLIAQYPILPSESLITAWTTPTLPQEPPRLLAAATGGIMRLLDQRMTPQGSGVRFGGYYPKGDWRNLHLTPVTGNLGLGVDSVVITDSRGALVHFDARQATLNIPPTLQWDLPDTTAPIIVPNLANGQPGIACRQTDQGGGEDHRITVLDSQGSLRWSADIEGSVLSDIVPATLDPATDQTPDLIIQWGRRSDDELHHRALSGATGEVLWNAEPQLQGSTRFPAGGAVTDWNQDGIDDFIHQYYGTHILSGADGARIAGTGVQSTVYFMPTVLDTDGDQKNELILHGGFNPVRVLDDDLATPLWISTDDDRPYPYGAIARTCPDSVPRLIEGSLRRPSTLKLTRLAGPEIGSYDTMVLAGGKIFDSEDSAQAAGVFLGQLTSTSVHENLTGESRAIALVGSEDGWLYGIDGCTGALVFTVPFGASVGAIAFGDTNGNGRDEIIVAAGDGYLYGLAEPPVRAPAWVIDIDPPRGINDEDVDSIVSTTSVSAAWEPVDEADGYEIAVVHAETGAVLTSPAWQSVGKITQATVSGLSLDIGSQYLIAVRAIKDAEPSPDTASDGVVIEPELGYPTGCICQSQRSTPRPGDLLILASLIALLAVVLRPARSRRRRIPS